jgi:hypothetical protein
MADADSDVDVAVIASDPARRRKWPRVVLVIALIVLAVLAGLWLSRERIAGNVIEGQLRQ